ncbi:MAG: hypothetical protein KC910_12810 [Candidatus Eremiobacteraeota bacterium]|nr:hypothetical protein [Candidatus Eremiobacteraeota bacterium]
MRRRGLSLIETVVAAALIGLVVLLVTNLFPLSLTGVRQQEQYLQADLLAGSVLADQQMVPFDQLTPGDRQVLDPVEADGVSYVPTVEIDRVSGSDVAYLKAVRVTVRWQYQGLPRQTVEETWVDAVGR